MYNTSTHYKTMGFIMRIDSKAGYYGKRICISIEDDLLDAYIKFSGKFKVTFTAKQFFQKKIYDQEIKNSRDAKLFIYSQMMKPSAFKCFAGQLSDQVDIEDV